MSIYMDGAIDVRLTPSQLNIIIEVLEGYDGPEVCAFDEYEDVREHLKAQRDIAAEATRRLLRINAPSVPIDPEIARMMEELG